MLRRIGGAVLSAAIAGALLAGCAYSQPGYYYYNGAYHYHPGGYYSPLAYPYDYPF